MTVFYFGLLKLKCHCLIDKSNLRLHQICFFSNLLVQYLPVYWNWKWIRSRSGIKTTVRDTKNSAKPNFDDTLKVPVLCRIQTRLLFSLFVGLVFIPRTATFPSLCWNLRTTLYMGARNPVGMYLPGYKGWQAGTKTRFLVPVDCSKIPAMY